jgi:two-component system sensor histidine kinase PilS (NtrC family)
VSEIPNLPGLLERLSRVRLMAAGVLLAAGGLLALWSPLPFRLLPFAASLVTAAAVSAVCLVALRTRLSQASPADLRRFAWLQLALDVVLETVLVSATGGFRSIFSFLYVLTITAASLILSRRGGMVIAGLSSLLYTGAIFSPPLFPWSGLPEPGDATALDAPVIFVNVGVFVIVALLTGTLAERIHQIRRALEDQGRNLQDLQAFKDLIFQSVGAGLIAMDASLRITAFNRAAEEITGFSADEATGRSWNAIFGGKISPDGALASAGGEGVQARRHEIRHRRKDGSEIPLGISFWPLRSGEGALVGVIGICQDLTEIKRMERRVREADRLAAIGRLAANIAHEIRNPLASLSGAIEVLVRDLPNEDTRERLAEIAIRESDRLNRIITEFLKYARPSPPQRRPVNMAEILDEVLLLLEQRPLQPGLKIIKGYQDPLSSCVDPQQMKQAIWNLCLNAAEAMPEGGEIRVSAALLPREKPEQIEISVSDTGAGIHPQDLYHIFEPFFSTKANGSGIGLAQVHRIVQDHGGEIEVRSEPGSGTTFRLLLPVSETEQE